MCHNPLEHFAVDDLYILQLTSAVCVWHTELEIIADTLEKSRQTRQVHLYQAL